MVETEKITINLSAVDIGRIDLLVEQGYFSNRTDFIRNAIIVKLDTYDTDIKEAVARKSMAIGVLAYSKVDLLKWKEKGEMRDFSIVGMLVLSKDIPPDLAVETIRSVNVSGVFRASDEVKAALADRIR